MDARLERGEVSERALELADALARELSPAVALTRVELELDAQGRVAHVWLHQKLRAARPSVAE
jgi:hypothetical protein